MKNEMKWELLRLFGEEAKGDDQEGSELTQRIETGENTEHTPVAGESQQPEARDEAFRRLMEGEYKDLFTAYFQETFNRRFREQKEIKEELERSRALVRTAAEYFGVAEDDLSAAIRTENEKRSASADIAKESTVTEAALQRAVAEAVETTRKETEARLLAGIRARGLRPAENALAGSSGTALRSDASRLSRAQRAELARRAAEGERIKF